MQQAQNNTLPITSVLPQLPKENVNRPMLSPFTWTNLTLPKKLQTIPEKAAPSKEKPKEKGALRLQKITHPSKELQSEQGEEKGKKAEATQPRQRTRSKVSDRLNRTIEVARGVERQRIKSQTKSPSHGDDMGKDEVKQQGRYTQHRMRFLDKKGNMQLYLQNSLARARHSATATGEPRSISGLNSTDFASLKPGQMLNHLQGSSQLTHKDRLHQCVNGEPFYPRSFNIGSEWEQLLGWAERGMVLQLLKHIGGELVELLGSDDQEQTCLSVVLGSVFAQTDDHHTRTLLCLCMYLESARRQTRLPLYFEHFKCYKPIDISPTPTLYFDLLSTAYQHLKGHSPRYDFHRLDYRLLVLLWHYHRLFSKHETTYLTTPLWIVKPTSSSRGAGISIHPWHEFCVPPEEDWKAHKIRRKYDNKIVQRYISDPYLLSRPLPFSRRKFDIRQWVLVCSLGSSPAIYRYHTGYCRFAQLPYRNDVLSQRAHLTNYSLNKGGAESVMMLEEVWPAATDDLRMKYTTQVDRIILQSVLRCQQLKYQEGTYELFGYDFLLNEQGSMHLLEINLDPACHSERHPGLQKEAEMMGKTMMRVVKGEESEKWIRINPQAAPRPDSQLCDPQRVKVRPFFRQQLDPSQSLIEMIRMRQYLIGRVVKIAEKYSYWQTWLKIAGREEELGKADKDEDSEPEIRWIEERQVSGREM